MTDLENRLKEAFDARAAAVRPSPHPAVENRYRVRRATHRRRLALACAAATAIAVTAPVAVSGAFPSFGARPGAASGTLVKKTGDLADLTEAAEPFKIPATASGTLLPVALSPDGAFLARTDRELWALGPLGAARDARVPELLLTGDLTAAPAPGRVPLAGFGITPRARVFLQTVGVRSGRLVCSAVSPSKSSVVNVDDPGRSVFADGEHIVYTETSGSAQALIACDLSSFSQQTGAGASGWFDKAHAVPVALADPTLVYLDSTNLTTLNEVDIGTIPPKVTRSLAVPRDTLPAKASDIGRSWVAAATKRTLAWVNRRTLHIVNRQGALPHPTTTVSGLPDMRGTGQLTVGDHVIAYTVTDSRGRVGSFVYDMRSGRRVTWPGRVFAAGDWLLWQDGRTPKIAKVR